MLVSRVQSLNYKSHTTRITNMFLLMNECADAVHGTTVAGRAVVGNTNARDEERSVGWLVGWLGWLVGWVGWLVGLVAHRLFLTGTRYLPSSVHGTVHRLGRLKGPVVGLRHRPLVSHLAAVVHHVLVREGGGIVGLRTVGHACMQPPPTGVVLHHHQIISAKAIIK